MRWIRGALPALLSLGIFSLLAAAGCDEVEDPCRPEVPAGRIQGRVRTGGLAIDAVIAATRIVAGVASEHAFETAPDDRGFYSLDVPEGDYTVTLRVHGYQQRYDYAGSALSYGNVPPDTVWVDSASSPIGIDFNLAGLTFDLVLSNALDGEQGAVVLHRRDAVEVDGWRTYVNGGSAEIRSGCLEVEVAGILPGEYQVEIVLGDRQYMCSCPYDGEHFWMPGTRDRTASPWYGIAADSLVALSCQIATEPAHLEGRISGAWRAMGLGEPELSIVSPDSVTIMGRRRVASDGSFAVDVHLPGLVKLRVTQDGVEQWIGGPSFGDADIYTLQLGQTIAGIELVQCGLRFELDAPRQDAGSAAFEFYDPVDLQLLAIAELDIGSARRIGISNLWPGEYLVHISHSEGAEVSPGLGFPPGWRPQWFDCATEAPQAQLITIAGVGDVVPLDLTLELGGAIGGWVVQSTGPARSYYIVVTPASDYAVSDYGYAWSENQAFTVQGLPDGEFKLGAWPAGEDWSRQGPPPSGTIWYPGTSNWDAAAILEINDANAVTGIVIAVP